MRDAVANDGNVKNLSSLVILSDTFTSSPRHMSGICVGYVMISYDMCGTSLIIFTCNPVFGQRSKRCLSMINYPVSDLIGKVFKQKQLKLIDVITKGHVFRVPACWMYIIE